MTLKLTLNCYFDDTKFINKINSKVEMRYKYPDNHPRKVESRRGRIRRTNYPSDKGKSREESDKDLEWEEP